MNEDVPYSWNKALKKDVNFNLKLEEMSPHGHYKKIMKCKKCGLEYGIDRDKRDDGYCPIHSLNLKGTRLRAKLNSLSGGVILDEE